MEDLNRLIHWLTGALMALTILIGTSISLPIAYIMERWRKRLP